MKPTKSDEPRVDHRIRVPEVLVIDSNGEKLGVLSTRDAISRAEEQGLNLVEVSPNSKPPVCKIQDWGKEKYKKKKEEKARRQPVVELKEIKLSPVIEEHDFAVKLRQALAFLSDGARVKTTMKFRGREMEHTDIGKEVLDRFLSGLGDVVVEQPPKLEGKHMTMVTVKR